MDQSATPLPQVIGANVRRLRGEFTMEQLANEGRAYGVSWSAGSIGAIERGAFKPTIETLAALTLALSTLGLKEGQAHGKVALSELIQSNGTIELNPSIWTETDDLEHWLRDSHLDVRVSPAALRSMTSRANARLDEVKSMRFPEGYVIDTTAFNEPSDTEMRLSKKAGIDPLELQVWARELWGRPIEDQRDVLAGDGATPQKKGRVSRELMHEVTEAIKRDHNGDD